MFLGKWKSTKFLLERKFENPFNKSGQKLRVYYNPENESQLLITDVHQLLIMDAGIQKEPIPEHKLTNL